MFKYSLSLLIMSTLAQVKIIYTLLGLARLRDEKDGIILAFTGNRTKSVSQMTTEEAKALIAHLKSLDEAETGATKMRNKILSLAHEMNWTRQIGSKKLIDMDHVNGWCISRSYLKKKLDDYTYNELPKLVTQFEEVYKSYLKGV